MNWQLRTSNDYVERQLRRAYSANLASLRTMFLILQTTSYVCALRRLRLGVTVLAWSANSASTSWSSFSSAVPPPLTPSSLLPLLAQEGTLSSATLHYLSLPSSSATKASSHSWAGLAPRSSGKPLPVHSSTARSRVRRRSMSSRNLSTRRETTNSRRPSTDAMVSLSRDAPSARLPHLDHGCWTPPAFLMIYATASGLDATPRHATPLPTSAPYL